jgi:hypothetical protein
MKHIPAVVAAAKMNLKVLRAPCSKTAIKQNKGSIGFYESDLFETVGETAQLAALEAGAARVVPERCRRHPTDDRGRVPS